MVPLTAGCRAPPLVIYNDLQAPIYIEIERRPGAPFFNDGPIEEGRELLLDIKSTDIDVIRYRVSDGHSCSVTQEGITKSVALIKSSPIVSKPNMEHINISRLECE